MTSDNDRSTPRAAVTLFSDSLALTPRQQEVLELLQDNPDGLTVNELSEHLGTHPNTLRGHLDELIAVNAVFSETAPARGRGRPRLIFKPRVPDNREVAHEYISLVSTLAGALASHYTDDEEALNAAHQLGTQWARQMEEQHPDPTKRSPSVGLNLDSATELLLNRFQKMGFDPESTPEEGDIHLRACPFVTISEDAPEGFVCAIHAGLVDHWLADSPAVESRVLPLIPEGCCTVRLHATEPEVDDASEEQDD